MSYRIAADLIVLFHFLFICFVVLGGLFTLRWRWVALIHLPAALWGALIVMLGGICPLTPFENSLRLAAGEQGYSGGFIEHYLVPIIYPAGLTRETQIAIGVLVVGINLSVYYFVFLHRSRRR
ncbi:MAG: DUF2784 domain-containing protein [Gammaproteobacteria bacterium]|nr:MAG: DUF2784 domain-containing protein [Gammaproteobacteria bacterium]